MSLFPKMTLSEQRLDGDLPMLLFKRPSLFFETIYLTLFLFSSLYHFQGQCLLRLAQILRMCYSACCIQGIGAMEMPLLH